ncbi:MAG: amidohydrolase [Rhizobiales bacterium]|nr:amidohydrolase [Hyphomicrobiales bacterium]MBI3673726.1 amidohydrolase [Hyphomicrobiales bacterium]
MPLLNSAIAMQPEITGWRRHLHMHPEILFEVQQTAAFVAGKLKSFGCDEVVTGIGRTGVVGIIRGRHGDGPTVGLRADMDALPMTEETGLAYASKVPGRAHACGHDGHTSMLLGAARHLAETRNFCGTVAVIFQPAEEGGAGGREMVQDGLMDRFAIASIYGLHNFPGLAIGRFAIRAGGIMAAVDEFSIAITGKGGHAAAPHKTIDPIFVGAQIVGALQGIAARNANPLDAVVVSVTRFNAGEANNVIPQTAKLVGTVRSLKRELRDLAIANVQRTAEGVAAALGATAKYENIGEPYPVTYNHAREVAIAADVARDVAGAGNVDDNCPPVMGGEDFSFMLEARPGAFIFMGNGDTPFCHHPAYDFADAAIPYGISYWVTLAEKVLAPA